jgi:uncharacterized protein YabE (DUF348 family)
MLKTISGAVLSLALFAGAAPNATAVTDTAPQSSSVTEAAAPAIRVVTLKKIAFKVGSIKPKATLTRATTVADFLAKRQITLGVTDVVKPALTTTVKKGMKIVVQRVSITTMTATEVVKPTVIKQTNPKKRRGVNKVLVAGTPGSAERTYTLTTVNGKLTTKVLVTETVLLAPVAKVVEVGTKGKPLNLAHLKLWNKIARCESGGNWHINTGNGYYGGLQFLTSTWLAHGGGQFAPRADLASREQQITVANRIYATSGLSQWGCKA